MRHTHQRGALLIEILVALSIFGLIAAIAAQSLVVSYESGEAAQEKQSGAELLAEMMRGVRGASDEQWQNLYSLTKDSVRYHVEVVNGSWRIVPGEELVSVSTTTYARYFTVTNVSRDVSTRAIEESYTAAQDDPSTQLVRAAVYSSSTAPLTVTEYLSRWRNETCTQTSWAGGSSSGVKECPDTTYTSKTNITAGSDLQLCSGGC